MENVRRQPNPNKKTEIFRRTCSKAFQPQSDPEALRTPPSRVFLQGAERYYAPLFHRIPHRTDVEVKEKRDGRSLVSGHSGASGSDASGHSAQVARFCKLCKTTKPF
ncbi:hypothetical protein QQF64_007425 [Cirrhinus molitorella]|uniref:Uncharacterized protein n=1 Tax=Cirrhinus molitorella TaxID=172907 RepID=A0ABR3MAM4_9TELE